MQGTVPESLKLRFLRFHLDPERGLGEAQWFTRATADDGKLNWTVESVTPDIVRIRLDGHAFLKRESSNRPTKSYHPTLLGYLSYHPKSETVTDFKMVALGNVLNTPRGVRPGIHPLGIAFELVRNPTPAERVVPRGGRDNPQRYLAMER